jgi:hypothetical protein
MSDRMRELRRVPSVRGGGGGLRPRAELNRGIPRRRPAVVRAVELESESVSNLRSARVRRYAVLTVALIIVVLAIRFVFSPLPHL